MKKILLNFLLLLNFQIISQDEITINSFLNNDQRDPQIILSGDNNLIVFWTSNNQINDSSKEDIFVQLLDPDLNKIGLEFQVNEITEGSQYYPCAAGNQNGNVVIAWSSFSGGNSIYDIKARIFQNSFPISSEFIVNSFTENSQTKPSVDVYTDGSFIIVWESWFQDGSDRGIFGQRFDHQGNKIGSEFQINLFTNFSQAKPKVKYFSDGKFVVVWESWKQDNPSGADYGIYARVFNSDGTPLTDEIQVNNYTKDYQWYADLLTIDSDNFVVAWCSWEQDGSDGGIYAKLFNPDGESLTNEILINSTVRYYQWLPKLSKTSNNNIAVAWSSWQQDGSREGIYVKLLDRYLRERSFEERLNITTESFQWEPDILSISDDQMISVWSGYNLLNKNYDVIGIKKNIKLKEAVINKNSYGHPSGISTTQLNVNVMDSTMLSGDTYEISFSKNPLDELNANITNKNTGELLISDFNIDNGEDVFYVTPVFEGVAVEIKPVLKLELDFNKSYFLNKSGCDINFSFVKPSGTTVIAPIDLVIIWGDPSKNQDGYFISPLDSAYSSSGKIEIKVPFTVKNLLNDNRLDSYIIESTLTKNKQWDPGEAIIVLTPEEYQLSFPNFHVQINSSVSSGAGNYPLPGDSIFIFTRRPLTTEDVFTFSTANQFVVSVKENSDLELKQFSLEQNYPNPFNSQSTIVYTLPVDAKATLKIYDILGRQIDILFDEFQTTGKHRIVWDAKNISSGVYFYRLQIADYVQTRKMILLK